MYFLSCGWQNNHSNRITVVWILYHVQSLKVPFQCYIFTWTWECLVGINAIPLKFISMQMKFMWKIMTIYFIITMSIFTALSVWSDARLMIQWLYNNMTFCLNLLTLCSVRFNCFMKPFDFVSSGSLKITVLPWCLWDSLVDQSIYILYIYIWHEPAM